MVDIDSPPLAQVQIGKDEPGWTGIPGKQPPFQQVVKARTLELLSQHKAHLARRYGVTGLALFGSTVQGEAREDSDINILVGFDCCFAP